METTKKINFLLILPFFHPHKGGSQRYAEEILVTLGKKHPNVKVDVLCYNTDNAPTQETHRGMRVFRIPCYNLIPARFVLPKPIPLLKMLKKLSENQYAYVNTHIRFFDPTWWVWKYAKSIGAKSIFTGHVPTHPIHQNKIVALVAKIVDLTVAKASLKRYDKIVFANKAAEKFFRKRLGIRRETSLVYIGVNTDEFKPKEKQGKRKLPDGQEVSPDTLVVTYLGRIIWTKGVELLYDAAKQILQTHPSLDVVFVIAGPGELEDALRNRSIRDNLGEKIKLTGSLEYQQVKKLLAISDIFVNPSHHNEGLPNTLLEAGSSGCLVIATDTGATDELIIDGNTGLLIPSNNINELVATLVEALNNQKAREMMARNLRKRVEQEFNWKSSANKFYELLTE